MVLLSASHTPWGLFLVMAWAFVVFIVFVVPLVYYSQGVERVYKSRDETEKARRARRWGLVYGGTILVAIAVALFLVKPT